MRTLSYVVFWVAWAFVAVSFLRTLARFAKAPTWSRADVAACLGIIALPAILQPQSVLPIAVAERVLLYLIPFALLLLLRRFRAVPTLLFVAFASLVVLGGVLTAIAADAEDAVGLRRWVFLLVTVGTVLVSLQLWREARKYRGGQGRRLTIGAVGGLCLALSFVVSLPASWSPLFGIAGVPYVRFLRAASYMSFFLAFTTPRWLLRRWQGAEREHYLANTAKREPEERGRLAPDDLFFGSARTIGGSVTFVATDVVPDSNALVVQVASHDWLVGRHVDLSHGVIAEAWRSEKPCSGLLTDVAADLRAQLSPHGVSILVAPIVGDARRWGVVAVVQRRGVLFPEDDLATLSQLAKYAATSLDHAQLILDRRDRERRLAEKRIREIESRVALMLDSIKDYALIVVDEHGRVATWQPGAEHLFGYSRAQMSGQSGARLFDLSEEAFALWLSEARHRGVAERDGLCRRLDDSTFLGTTVVRPLVDEPGEPPAFAVVTHDVTERHEMEARLRQGQKMEAIGQLAGGIAHDFNNLLTAILGYADWLERDLENDPRSSQVREIQKAAERAADLTSQLLTFSRRQARRPVHINLSTLVGDLLPMLRRIIGDRIEIADGTSAGLAQVYGDRTQLEQVVMNLVVNARDAMPGGGRIVIRTGEVWVGGGAATSARSSGQHIVLEVTDNGTGMDAETRRRAFEPFFTTKEIGRGTGLGLSTVYGIVQQMDGTVEIESEVGRGTTFRLSFPAFDPAVAGGIEAAEASHGHETLLLIEDDAALRTYLKQVLESHGYRVIAAEHPRSALALTHSFDGVIDLVISDVVMPGSAGPELVQLLGQKRPGLSALYLSGHTERDFDAGAYGDDDVEDTSAPVTSTELLSRIRRILSAA